MYFSQMSFCCEALMTMIRSVNRARNRSIFMKADSLERAEITVKHVAVKGVDQPDLSSKNPLSVQTDAGQPSQGSCFGCVGVNDVGFEFADDLSQFGKGSQVIEERRFLFRGLGEPQDPRVWKMPGKTCPLHGRRPARKPDGCENDLLRKGRSR